MYSHRNGEATLPEIDGFYFAKTEWDWMDEPCLDVLTWGNGCWLGYDKVQPKVVAIYGPIPLPTASPSPATVQGAVPSEVFNIIAEWRNNVAMKAQLKLDKNERDILAADDIAKVDRIDAWLDALAQEAS